MSHQISLKKYARLTGLLYFLLAILGVFNLEYIPAKIVVSGDADATSRNIIEHESLYRIGIAVSMLNSVLYIILAFMFYRLFKNINKRLAVLLVVFVLVQVPAGLVFDALDITSVRLLKGEVLKSVDPQHSREYAILFRNLISHGTRQLEIFWGLWLLPMGILAYRSGFIPRIVGVLVLITGFAYMFESIGYIILPGYTQTIGKFMFPLFFGELSIIFWLLIAGVKKQFAGQLLAD